MCKSKKANEAAKQKPSKPIEEVEASCHEEEVVAKILSVEFLDGTDDKILGAEGKQFVNLPYEDKWVDGVDVLNKDRLGYKPRIKVKFDKTGSHSFKLKFVAEGTNASFSDDEKTRNSKFKYQDKEISYSTKDDGSVIITDFFVAIAGDDVYSLSATDDKGTTVKSTGKIRTLRMFNYVEIKMKGLASIASSLSTVEAEYTSNFMKLKALPSVEMDHIENIGSSTTTFSTKAKTAYLTSDGTKNEPYTLAIGYTDHLAVKGSGKVLTKADVEVGPTKLAVNIKIVGAGDTNPAIRSKYLWKNIVTGEDWFVSCKFLKDGGDAKTDTVDIEKAKITPVEIRTDMSCEVNISVDHLPAGKGTITLTVNWVDRMRGGLAIGSGNLICVCSRAWWQNVSTADQNQVIIHEMGHKVGMASKGTGILPEKISTYYDDSKGHVGSHCHNGIPDSQARFDNAADGALAVCVMYGATSSKTAFCGVCKPIVRKLDVTSGWGRF